MKYIFPVGRCDIEVSTFENKHLISVTGEGFPARRNERSLFRDKIKSYGEIWIVNEKSAMDCAKRKIEEIVEKGVMIGNDWIFAKNIVGLRIVNSNPEFMVEKEVEEW